MRYQQRRLAERPQPAGRKPVQAHHPSGNRGHPRDEPGFEHQQMNPHQVRLKLIRCPLGQEKELGTNIVKHSVLALALITGAALVTPTFAHDSSANKMEQNREGTQTWE
jgi:hypothetical protein